MLNHRILSLVALLTVAVSVPAVEFDDKDNLSTKEKLIKSETERRKEGKALIESIGTRAAVLKKLLKGGRDYSKLISPTVLDEAQKDDWAKAFHTGLSEFNKLLPAIDSSREVDLAVDSPAWWMGRVNIELADILSKRAENLLDLWNDQPSISDAQWTNEWKKAVEELRNASNLALADALYFANLLQRSHAEHHSAELAKYLPQLLEAANFLWSEMRSLEVHATDIFRISASPYQEKAALPDKFKLDVDSKDPIPFVYFVNYRFPKAGTQPTKSQPEESKPVAPVSNGANSSPAPAPQFRRPR